MRRTSCGVSVTSQASLGHKGSHAGDPWRRESPPLRGLTFEPGVEGFVGTLPAWRKGEVRGQLSDEEGRKEERREERREKGGDGEGRKDPEAG